MKVISVLFLAVMTLQGSPVFSQNSGQGKGTSSAEEIINNALYSEYILAYKEFRNTLYKQVWEIKEMDLSDSAMTEIKKSYFPLQANTKKWLDDMMNDLLDKKARKQFEADPEFFNTKYTDNLNAIVSNYNANFLKEYNKQLTAQSRVGFGDIPDILKKAISWFKQMWGVDKTYLREKYEKPLLIKSWSDVTEKDFVE
jgi:hypothetical protein